MHQVRKENNIRWPAGVGDSRKGTTFCIVPKRCTLLYAKYITRDVSFSSTWINHEFRGIWKWRKEARNFYHIWKYCSILISGTKNRTRRKDRERILFPSAVASTRSGNEWFVGGERERESLYYHIHEASISKSMSWSDGASGQRGRSHNQSLEECQCQGLARPEATTKPVRSHVSDHHSVLKQY